MECFDPRAPHVSVQYSDVYFFSSTTERAQYILWSTRLVPPGGAARSLISLCMWRPPSISYYQRMYARLPCRATHSTQSFPQSLLFRYSLHPRGLHGATRSSVACLHSLHPQRPCGHYYVHAYVVPTPTVIQPLKALQYCNNLCITMSWVRP